MAKLPHNFSDYDWDCEQLRYNFPRIMSRNNRNRSKSVKPFVKWVGGKGQLMTVLADYLPSNFTHYYEPFVGGGAMLFHLQPQSAVINDLNSELINAYNMIKHNVTALLADLCTHQNEEKYFYALRNIDRTAELAQLTDVQRASRMIFLNKTCYNGLYRVNAAGEFNAPFGRYKNPDFVNEKTLLAVHNYLNENNITILNESYEESLAAAPSGAFVYFDPPYDPVSDSANFTGYTKGGFGKADQRRLKQVCDQLNERGVQFLLSNSATPFICDLYANYDITHILANRSVNSDSSKRGKVDEILVRNYA